MSLLKDGIECRDSYHFTGRESMHGLNITRAGAETRKTIRWKQGFQVIFIQHARCNPMLEDPRKARGRSVLLNELREIGFCSRRQFDKIQCSLCPKQPLDTLYCRRMILMRKLMQYRPHIEIRIANLLVKGLGILRTQHIKGTVRDIGSGILRSGNFNRGGRNFSAYHLCEMIRKKARLRSIAAPQVNQRKSWVGIVLKPLYILLSRMDRIDIPKDFAGCSAQGTPVVFPGRQITISHCQRHAPLYICMIDRDHKHDGRRPECRPFYEPGVAVHHLRIQFDRTNLYASQTTNSPPISGPAMESASF